MQNFELKISIKDWLLIVIIGILFGLLISLFFYFTIEVLRDVSTIVFSIFCSFLTSIIAASLITLSNRFILPNTKQKFWYLISFLFSFLSGFLGFSFTYFIYHNSSNHIVKLISPYWIEIGTSTGLLTFLIGLILHRFIAMKYWYEFNQNEILQTKLDTLESELNPHFLFNALNSITELIYQNPTQAENAILKLSKLLRNAINKKGLIDLKNELLMVQTYIDIENIRFNNKIHCKINTLEKYNDTLLPKFSIQLLVENAIKHGFTGDDLHINIDVFENKIEVSNDGQIDSGIHFGTGLNNLQKRLKLLKIGLLQYDTNNTMLFRIVRR